MKAIIQKAELRRIDEIWKKHKPQGLGFSDTDVVMLKVKVAGGGELIEDFYCRLKGDGTLGHSITKASEKRQQNLRNFLDKYISKDKMYDIREGVGKWKGKTVEVEKIGDYFTITL